MNVTLLFSRGQHLAAAEANLRGIKRRIEAGLGPEVGSLASLFISRWDKAVMGKVPAELRNHSSPSGHRWKDIPGLPRSFSLAPVAETCPSRSAAAAPHVGQHRHEMSVWRWRSSSWTRPFPALA